MKWFLSTHTKFSFPSNILSEWNDDTELRLIIAKKNGYVIEILHLEQLFLDWNENIWIRIKLC